MSESVEKVLITIILALLFAMAFVDCARAEAIDEQTMVKCVLGEYESGTFDEMTATAEALRNRGTTKGVFGCKAVKGSRNDYKRGTRIIPAYAVKRAIEAVRRSKTSNFTHSAKHWESTDFKEPYWAKNMNVTATIGKHRFYA